MTTLYHGQFCIPSSEKEWNAVFDTANILGLRVAHRRSYSRYPCIVFDHNGLRDEDDQGRELDIPTNHLSVLDFLIGMIGLREAKEKMPKVEFMGFAPDHPETKSFSDAIKEAIEPLRQELLSANERITKLEGSPLWNVAHIVNGNWVFEKGTSDAVMAIVQPLTDRITKLENDRASIRYPGSLRDRITNLEDTIQSHKLGLEQHFDRLGKLEEFEENVRCGRVPVRKPLLERPDRITIQNKIDDDKKVVSTSGLDWAIVIDPAASPKNTPFSVALEYLKAGREVRRARWRDGALKYDYANKWITGSPLLMVADTNMIAIPVRDILATDWEVIPETKKP